MNAWRAFTDLFMNLDGTLGDVIARFGGWSYALLFVVIFCETGLVVTPFLPGDSLLFAAGTFAAAGAFDVVLLAFVLILAAVLGDTVNYWVGRSVGTSYFEKNAVFRIRKEHLEKTRRFYERHGGKTIILARFVPIVRTFAPFVAGVGKMEYGTFITYNVVGGIVWVSLFVFLGYFFGNIPVVRENFEIVILGIVVVSILPGLVEWLRHRRSG